MSERVKRLGTISLIALGLIWALAAATLSAPAMVGGALAAGWVLMPMILFASLSRPRLRYALVVPGSLVGIALLAICIGWLPDAPLAAIGWWLITVGVLIGSVMGLWFWYRLVPVPGWLDDPYAGGRWAVITLHVALIVAGLGLAALPLLS